MDNTISNSFHTLHMPGMNFKQQASLEELETSDARGIPAGAITQLSTGEYLKNGATIVISGPTGTGKSFLACLLANEPAGSDTKCGTTLSAG